MQKYRSHRKHLLAREAEAASWSQKRQMYGVAAGGGGHKREMGGWIPPTMGFPHITPMHHHPFRPLHVWGHPTVDQSAMHMWPKHLPHSPSPPPPPPPTWPPSATPPSPSPDPYWHPHHQRVSSLSLSLSLSLSFSFFLSHSINYSLNWHFPFGIGSKWTNPRDTLLSTTSGSGGNHSVLTILVFSIGCIFRFWIIRISVAICLYRRFWFPLTLSKFIHAEVCNSTCHRHPTPSHVQSRS